MPTTYAKLQPSASKSGFAPYVVFAMGITCRKITRKNIPKSSLTIPRAGTHWKGGTNPGNGSRVILRSLSDIRATVGDQEDDILGPWSPTDNEPADESLLDATSQPEGNEESPMDENMAWR